MNSVLDPHSPVPLYHQIAESIRHRVATGRLQPGEQLATVRQAARELGVNLHTVRRAYSELVREGLIESRGARGTRVSQPGSGPGLAANPSRIDRFVDRVLQEAREQYGLGARELSRLLGDRNGRATTQTVHVIECSPSQALDHAREIERQFLVNAIPWSLDNAEEPPSGAIIATYFHYNDIRRRWARRLPEIHFISIQPDPALAGHERLRRKGSGQVRLRLCEFDESKALNIAADLALVLPADRFTIQPVVIRKANELLKRRTTTGPILFAPRVWDRLTEAEQAEPRSVKVPYVILDEQMAGIAERFGWPRRGHHL